MILKRKYQRKLVVFHVRNDRHINRYRQRVWHPDTDRQTEIQRERLSDRNRQADIDRQKYTMTDRHIDRYR